MQTVSDSSRYFVIAVNDSHLGLGFADRSDSFDLNTSLADHFKGTLIMFDKGHSGQSMLDARQDF